MLEQTFQIAEADRVRRRLESRFSQDAAALEDLAEHYRSTGQDEAERARLETESHLGHDRTLLATLGEELAMLEPEQELTAAAAEESAARWEGTGWPAAVLEARASIAEAEGDTARAARLRLEACALYEAADQLLDAERCRAAVA